MKKKSLFLGPLAILLTVSRSVYAEPSNLTSANLSLSQSCIQSVCGTDNPMAHPFSKSANYEKEVTSLISRNLDKPLKNYMGRVIHRNLAKDKLYKKIISSLDSLTLPAELLGLMNSILFLNKLETYGSALEFVDGDYKFDVDKLKKLEPDLSPEAAAAIVSFSPSMSSIIRLSSLMNKPFEVVIKSLQPNETLAEGQKKLAITILYANQMLEAKVPLLSKTSFPNLVVLRAAQGATLSESNKKIFLQKLMNAYAFMYLLRDETQSAFGKVPVDLVKIKNTLKAGYLNSALSKTLENKKTIKEEFKSAVNQCTSMLANAYASFPTMTQLNDFKKIYGIIESTAKQIVEERTKTSIGSELAISPILPTAREEMMKSMSDQLIQLVSQNELMIDQLNKLDLNDPEIQKTGLILLAMFGRQSLFDEALEFCNQQQIADLNDSALSEFKMINLSWPTIQYYKLGIGVVAHELGHVVSAKFASLLTPEKQCLTNMQKIDKYVEEDFADLFAKEVERRMGFKFQKKQLGNLGCALVGRTTGGWVDEQLVNNEPADPHSTGFYRMLAIAAGPSGLTKECRAYTDSVKETRFDSYCKWGSGN